MFPSPNSSSNLAPFPFLSDFNFHSASPNYFHHQDFSSIFLQPSLNMDITTTTTMADDVIKPKKQAAPRKRTSKKDRHSKIYTAKGLRDRRMRLSLDVARRFFDLQDMLGFDKASRTVEWLLNQSEPSIDQVKKTLIGNRPITAMTRSSSSPSVTTDCDVAYENIVDGSSKIMINSRESGSASRAKIDARESRKMARARAKERTLEKMWILQSSNSNNGGSKAPAHQQSVAVEELGQSLLISYMKLPSMDQFDTRQQQLGLGHQQHDDVVVATAGHTHSQQHLYTDLQLLTKPWEAFNNNSPNYLC